MVFQVYVNKEEIPVRGGDCILCYFSSALHCIIGVSEPFKVQYKHCIDIHFLRSSITSQEKWVVGRLCHQTADLSQVLESRVALEEGLLAEKLNELDQAVAAEDLGNTAVRDHTCGMM